MSSWEPPKGGPTHEGCEYNPLRQFGMQISSVDTDLTVGVNEEFLTHLVPFQLNEPNLRNSALCEFVEQMRTGPRRNKLERYQLLCFIF